MYRIKTFASFKVTLPVFIFLSLCILFNFFSPKKLFGADKIKADNLQLRVMSFNIRYGTANDGKNRWNNRREMVFDVLRNHKPDVVGLQEALRFQIDQIRNTLPAYGEIGVAREDGKTDGEYCGASIRSERDQAGTPAYLNAGFNELLSESFSVVAAGHENVEVLFL